ncbi:hypothetical protein K6U06_10685 [Acidiferrimicrobium sp. IK]|uniref:hypothetical protein n=1 Tax=Acidiferrimicrobium sp. IK TaxID=2871700 RepID=UPI0021CB78FB|nr:hypothetical protein [Acidiferrimicrobium sp. IK]MCU4184825.1 hypothetical protein [Acidiferrimicrobium sp. IK]
MSLGPRRDWRSALSSIGDVPGRAAARDWVAQAKVDAMAEVAEAQVKREREVADAAAAVQAARTRVDGSAAEQVAAAQRHTRQVELVETVRAAVAARHESLAELRAAAESMLAAVREWQHIDDQAQNTEAALVTLWERHALPGAVSVNLESAMSDMTEAERVLWRADRRRRSAVATAERELARARLKADDNDESLRRAFSSWWDGDPEPDRFALVGMVRLREAAMRRGQAGGEARLAAEADLEAAQARHAEALAAASNAAADDLPPTDVGALVMRRIASLAAGSGEVLALHDVCRDLDDDTLAQVLEGLSTAKELSVAYVTSDPRVLAWAMTLPEDVGGIAGVHTGVAQD